MLRKSHSNPKRSLRRTSREVRFLIAGFALQALGIPLFLTALVDDLPVTQKLVGISLIVLSIGCLIFGIASAFNEAESNRSSENGNLGFRHMLSKFARLVSMVAFFALLPAAWSFFDAIYAAATTGKVTLIALGSMHTSRSIVQWTMGWPRFLGPILIFASLYFWSLSNYWEHWLVRQLSAVLALVGLLLLMFSEAFTSIGRSAIFVVCLVIAVFLTYVEEKLSRLAVIIMFTAIAVAFLKLAPQLG